MANISKDNFNPAKGFDKVIFTQAGAVLDFDFNEAQDILRARMDAIVAQMAEGVNLFGSTGQVTPPVSGQGRRVDVTGGLALHAGKVVRLPATADLRVFDDATVSGVATSLVYVDWFDEELTAAQDASIAPVDQANFGLGHARLKRTVVIKAAIGTTVLPAPAAGHNVFRLGTVTRNFAGGAVIQTGDVAMEPAAPTPGELAGFGAARTLKLVSNSPATADGVLLDTRVAHTAGALLKVANLGSVKLQLTHDGKLGIGITPAEALHVNGNGRIVGTFDVSGDFFVGGTVDGVDVSAHAHTGLAGQGAKLDHGAALLGLADDDHPQYVHIGTDRLVTAQHTFAPTTQKAPFLLGPNAQGQTVAGLDADTVDGKHAADLAVLSLAQTVSGAWTFNANVALGPNITVDGVDLSKVKDSADGVDHAKLSGLTVGDPHTQYLHLTAARTVGARHTFNPLSVGAPFIIGANALSQLVSGLNAEYVGGQKLVDLDDRFLKTDGTGVMVGDLNLGAFGLALAGAVAVSRAAQDVSVKAPAVLKLGGGGVDTHVSVAASGDVTVSRNLSVTQRARFPGNAFDNGGAPVTASISASGALAIDSVGKRALVHFIRVNPGAYAGTYDVKVYADNTTATTLLAEWQGQTGEMEDRVPWVFRNDRSDERLYVQVTKGTTGTAHTFTVTLQAERFA